MCHFSELAPELWFLFMGMQYLNIFTPNLRAPEYVKSEPTARATWLNIMAYCADQENGGTIEDCAEWGDRQWLSLCGVTKAEAESAAPLVIIKNGTATVWAFPKEAQEHAQRNRDNGARGALAKRAKATSGASSPPTSGADSGASRKGKEMEGNERKEKEMEAHAHCNKPRWEEPTGPEFIEFFIPKLACLGQPLTLRDWLGQQYGWLASDQWPKGNKLKWKTLEFDFASRYRSRHAEVKSKNPAVQKATGFTPEDFINPMDEEVRKACGLPAGTKLKR